MKKKILLWLLRIIISAGLIGYFLFTLADQQGGLIRALIKIIEAFSSASPKWLVPAFLLHLAGFALISLRWKFMLKAQDIDASYKKLFQYYIMAAFFNTFLPSTIGGDALRAIKSRQFTGKATTSVMVVIMERITGLVALLLIAIGGLLIKTSGGENEDSNIRLLLLALITGFILIIVLAHPRIAPKFLGIFGNILPKKIHSILTESYTAVSIYYRRPLELAAAISISIIFQLNMVLYYFLIALALNQNPDLIDFMVKVPIMIVLLMTIPAINGLGIRTASFRQLMKFPPAFALSGELIDLGMRISYGLLGGIVFVIHRHSVPQKNSSSKTQN